MAEDTKGRKYYLYAIVLQKDVLNNARFREANPGYVAPKNCYYIGSSSHDPHTRFLQHKRGYRSSKWVREFGRFVAPRRCKEMVETRPNDRDVQERLYAERLRAKGYGIWQN